MNQAYCNRSLLENYLDYAEFQESPLDFHLWVLLTLTSAATARKVFLSRAYYKLYPNVYSSVVAESAWCRKSISMDIGMSIFIEAFPEYPVLSGKITPAELISFLAPDEELGDPNSTANVFIHADEMSVFFSNSMVVEGMVDLITTMYMCPNKKDFRTKTQGTYIIYNSYLTILSGTVPSYLQKNVGDAFKEGFIGRNSYCHREKRKRKTPRPEVVVDFEKMQELREVIIQQLRSIGNISGEFSYNEEAGLIYDKWYEEIPDKDTSGDNKTFSTGYKGRIGDHVLKFAMLHHLCNSVEVVDLILTDKDILTGIKLAESAEASLTTIFEDIEMDIFRYQDEIEKIIRSSGKVMRSILFSKFRKKITVTQFDIIIHSLKVSCTINEKVEGKSTYYYWNVEEG